MRKWPYLSPEATNLKNKGTLFSSTLKVEEKKVSLFFGFVASGQRYGHFVILMIVKTWSQTKKIKLINTALFSLYRSSTAFLPFSIIYTSMNISEKII